MKLYGRSDDLIEVEGAVSEEFYANYGEPSYIEIGRHYVFEVKCDSEGIWRIQEVKTPNAVDWEITPAEDMDSYSDVARIECLGYDVEVSKIE